MIKLLHFNQNQNNTTIPFYLDLCTICNSIKMWLGWFFGIIKLVFTHLLIKYICGIYFHKAYYKTHRC